jgi:hypothetical protein
VAKEGLDEIKGYDEGRTDKDKNSATDIISMT